MILPLAILVLSATLGPQEARAPVPEAAAQKKAEKTVRDLFTADYAKRDPDSRRALAEKLLKSGLETANDPVSRYVLLREARDFAVLALDFETAFAAVDALAASFEVKREELKEECLKAGRKGAKAPEDAARVANGYLSLAESAIEAGNHDTALRAARAAADVAKIAQDPDLVVRSNEQAKDIPELKKEHAIAQRGELTLSLNPDDPEACLNLGRLLCFGRNEWDKGLPLLARSGQPALAEAAKKELAKPEGPAALAEAGDEWHDAAEKEKVGAHRRRYLSRARHWYDLAWPGLTGLARAKVDKRLQEMEKETAGRGGIDLLKLVDLAKDTLQGQWTPQGSALATGGFSRLRIPYLPPEEYDLKVTISWVLQGGAGAIVGLVGGGKQFLFGIDAWNNQLSGLEIIDRRTGDQNDTTYRGRLLADDSPKPFLISVRRTRVTVQCDGKKIIDWPADWSKITLRPNWAMPETEALFIGSLGRYQFHQLILVPLSGQGRRLR